MRRRDWVTLFLRRAMLALLLGALATWGGGWGFAVWEQRRGGTHSDPYADGVWAREKVQGVRDPVTPLFQAMMGSPIARHDMSKLGTSLVMLNSGLLQPTEVRFWTFGWPLRCLEFTEKGPAPYTRAFRPLRTSTWINGWAIDLAAGTRVILPIRIRGWEMAGDIGIWSAIVGALLLGVPAARRTVRRRRGQCGACGYDRSTIGAALPCPECGTAPLTSPP